MTKMTMKKSCSCFLATALLVCLLFPFHHSAHAVLISHEERGEYTSLADSLIASALCSMEFMQAFGQVLDFVESYDSKQKEESRRRFRQWQDLGVNPRFIKAA